MRRSWLIPWCLAALTGCAAEDPLPTGAGGRPDVVLPQDSTVVRGVVPRNATLDAILRAHGLAGDAVAEVASVTRRVFDPRRLRSLQPFLIELTLEGALRKFEYEIDAASLLRVVLDPVSETLHAEVLAIPRTLEHAAVAGSIHRGAPSLFAAMAETGESDDLAMAVAAIFAGEIDFNTEVQPGDRFAVVFERFRREGRGGATYGAVAAAEFSNEGRVVRAIRFTPEGGEPGYYDEQGRSLRRFFLRSPLKFEPRVTSRFSSRRMHPVLHTVRAHRGVDYGAPTGAEVVAVASGTVVSATYDATNGRMVRLRHPSGYETYYLHLSAFGPGVRAGARVAQGQTIGRVGATGLATGPHLHYGVTKNGAWVDPLAEHRRMPPGEPVPPHAMAAFEAERDQALARLADAALQAPPGAVAASD